MAKTLGVKIVLSASATEMSDYYNNPFVAFVGGFSTGPVPKWFTRKTLYPPAGRQPDGRAQYAPYGLRKVEALLLENGFTKAEVAVAHPADLDKFVGPNTKVVGISSMDPTGMGYVSKTYSSLIGGGTPINAVEFKALMKHPSIKAYKPKVVVGGYGSWQLERKKLIAEYGVDHLVIGGKGEEIVEIFKKIVNNEPLPQIIRIPTDMEQECMPEIKHAAIHGEVEISKGCGRNCQFCTPTMQKKVDIPLQKILKEAELTVREGSERITLITEDLFLYGSKGKTFIPNREAVTKLVRSIAAIPGVKGIQPSHMSLAPVVFDQQMVKEVAEVLVEHNCYYHNGRNVATAETGVETGSSRLMRKYMSGKMLPYSPEQWQEIVTQAFGILNDNDWYPLATLIIGLPGETEEDMAQTLELMDNLKGYNAFYVPLFFVPLENCALMNKKGTEMDNLTKIRWDFLIRCWEYNVRIWRDTFIGNRIPNPTLAQVVKRGAIPFAAKIAQTYYGLKHYDEVADALWKLATC